MSPMVVNSDVDVSVIEERLPRITRNKRRHEAMEIAYLRAVLLVRCRPFFIPVHGVLDLEQDSGAVGERRLVRRDFRHFSAVWVEFRPDEDRLDPAHLGAIRGGCSNGVVLAARRGFDLQHKPDEKIIIDFAGGVKVLGNDVVEVMGLTEIFFGPEIRHRFGDFNELNFVRQDDAETGGAAASDCPEEIFPHRFPVQNSTVHIYDPCVHHVVGGQAVPADQVAISAAGEVASHPHGRADCGWKRMLRALLRYPIVELAEGSATLHPRSLAGDINL
nr:hypothetical protein TorRG33x02_032410 [Ipomoea batatas]